MFEVTLNENGTIRISYKSDLLNIVIGDIFILDRKFYEDLLKAIENNTPFNRQDTKDNIRVIITYEENRFAITIVESQMTIFPKGSEALISTNKKEYTYLIEQILNLI